MPSTNKCNLEDDEKLAAQVERYPCLYDKSRDDYKDKGVKETAWQVIDYELGFNQGEAEKKFEILKKRFSRKRIDAKRARMSGPSHYDISTAKKAYEEYSFLSWYEPYIRDKKTSLDVATYDDGVMFGRHIGEFDDDDQIEDKLHLPEDSVEVHDDDHYGSDSMTYDVPSFVRKHWVKREAEERRPLSGYQTGRPGTSRDDNPHTRTPFSQDHSNDIDTNNNDNASSKSTTNSNSRSNSNWNSPSTSSNNDNDDNSHINTPLTSKSSDSHVVLSSRPISVQQVHKTNVGQGREIVYRNHTSENVGEHMIHEPRADAVLADRACSSPVFNNPGSSRIVDTTHSGSHISPPTPTTHKVQPQMSPDEAFGQMIASELSTFDDDLKFLVKNDLNKVIFEYRLKQRQMRRQNSTQ